MERKSSPGRRTLRLSPVTKSTTDTERGSPSRGQSVQIPSSAAVREIIGPAGSDMQMFPPTVASFQILNEARKERQHSRRSGAANHSAGAFSTNRSSSTTLHVAAISNPLSEGLSGGQFSY